MNGFPEDGMLGVGENRPYKYARRKSADTLTDYVGPGFYVLLGLMAGPAHASEVQRRIVGINTGNWVRETTLRDEIGRLEGLGLVKVERAAWPKVIKITQEGERMLKLRAAELARVMDVARKRHLC